MGGAFASPATPPRRPSGTSTATRRPRRSSSAPGRAAAADGHPAAARPRPRRHRAGDDPARPRRRASPGAPAARRTTRSRSRAARTRCTRPGPWRATRRPLRRRRAALLHGVPRPVRRLLRRVHPRSAGRRRRPRPEPGHDRGARRRRRAGGELTTGETVPTGAASGASRRTSTSRSRPTPTSSCAGSSSASEGWRRTARRGTLAAEGGPGASGSAWRGSHGGRSHDGQLGPRDRRDRRVLRRRSSVGINADRNAQRRTRT